MRYEGSIYRPPSEARSYILQCTIGCSHNSCTFCGMYKDKKFRVRPLEDILTDIRLAKLHYGDVNKVFLSDGDALIMDTKDLEEILDQLYGSFKSLKHVGIYANPKSILNKTKEDLKFLAKKGLTIAYLGIETGNPQLLREIKKGATYEEMVEAGRKIREAGITLSATIILGLAGRTPLAAQHAVDTARICNDINPDYIGALTLMLEPGTVLYRRWEKGEFELPGPFEILDELRIIISHLNVTGTEFRSNHASNYLPIKGRLPEEKQKMLDLIDQIIFSKDSKYLRPDYLRAL
ncbi:MAG: radical SAM protein [Syntrophomonadaceae bacterium]|jgi:radical SAM superfamily enzyme YgiQ (UPF0313 family)